MKVPFFIEREGAIHNTEPAAADGIERPGRGSEKVDHGKIAVWRESQVPDDGGNPKFIGTEHKSYGNGNKPTEGSLARETGFKLA
jgi:hypothetical protein